MFLLPIVNQPVIDQTGENNDSSTQSVEPLGNSKYSFADSMASTRTNCVLACLLDNVDGSKAGNAWRTHNENRAEANQQRQRCLILNGRATQKHTGWC